MIEQAFQLLKPRQAPCSYAAVAIGSLARGESTPYSDLEFLFLIEKSNKQAKSFFHDLAIAVYFVIGNLGETDFDHMNIEISDRKLEALYRKASIRIGFTIDGIKKTSGNIPTGNGLPGQKEDRFILTVDELVEEYKKVWFSQDKLESLRGDLTAMLASTVCISGEKALLEEFKISLTGLIRNESRREADLNMLLNDIQRHSTTLDSMLQVKRQLKKDFYRFPSILLHDLKICCGSNKMSSRLILEDLIAKGDLSDSVKTSIEFLLCSAQYIRMAAYSKAGSRTEDISVLPQIDDVGSMWRIPSKLFEAMCLELTALRKLLN